MARELHQRPSLLIGLTRPTDGWPAFQLDAAITFLGRWVDGRLAEMDDEYRPKYRLSDLLADPGERKARTQGTAGKYRSPRELMVQEQGGRR